MKLIMFSYILSSFILFINLEVIIGINSPRRPRIHFQKSGFNPMLVQYHGNPICLLTNLHIKENQLKIILLTQIPNTTTHPNHLLQHPADTTHRSPNPNSIRTQREKMELCLSMRIVWMLTRILSHLPLNSCLYLMKR